MDHIRIAVSWLDRPSRRVAAPLAVAVALAACGGGSSDTADPTVERAVPGPADACRLRANATTETLLQCVTVSGVRTHLEALQAIADAHNGTRVSGSQGYDASVEYVRGKLEAAGYLVTVQEFQFQTFVELSPTVLEQVAPAPAASIVNNVLEYSGSGDVTASVSVPPRDPRGCSASDFAGFPAGNIALIARGESQGFPVACTFDLKATNASSAGASGVIIYNNATGAINGTLGSAFTLNLPVTSVTQAIGQQLAATPGLVMRLKADTFRGIATSANVLAESREGDPGNVLMVGAHLDSVNEGPGIQDNGSGSATILEVALQMANVRPRNKLRFAWWGAEEASLVGSTHYVTQSLTQAERARIALYLNFDMIASPNHVFFVYDGDDSDAVGAGAGPDGSAQIEAAFAAFYTRQGVPFKGTDFSGRSDYGPFIANGIPSGGLFTGAEGLKTAAEAATWGGTAGMAYDPCYHQACDTLANVNETALGINADAVAAVTLRFAMNTEDVNSVRGRGNFKPGPLEYAGPRQVR